MAPHSSTLAWKIPWMEEPGGLQSMGSHRVGHDWARMHLVIKWHPTPVLLPGKSHGWRSLVGYSPWGLTESDMTEWLHFHFSLSCTGEGNSNPLQCSCLENPRDGGAWWAAIYGVAQSRTRLKRLSSSSSSCIVVYCLEFYSALGHPLAPFWRSGYYFHVIPGTGLKLISSLILKVDSLTCLQSISIIFSVFIVENSLS